MWHARTLFIAINRDVGSSHKRELTENVNGYKSRLYSRWQSDQSEGGIAAWVDWGGRRSSAAAAQDKVSPDISLQTRSDRPASCRRALSTSPANIHSPLDERRPLAWGILPLQLRRERGVSSHSFFMLHWRRLRHVSYTTTTGGINSSKGGRGDVVPTTGLGWRRHAEGCQCYRWAWIYMYMRASFCRLTVLLSTSIQYLWARRSLLHSTYTAHHSNVRASTLLGKQKGRWLPIELNP